MMKAVETMSLILLPKQNLKIFPMIFNARSASDGTPISVEPVVIEMADKAPDLEDGIPYIIQSQQDTKLISKGSTLIMNLRTLFEEMEILFDISAKD